MSLSSLLQPLDELMQRAGVRFAIIGAYAVAAWGTVRATRDIDLLIETKDVNLLRIALSEAGFHFEYRTGDPDDPIEYVIRLHLVSEDDLQEIDVLAGIKGSPSGITDRAAIVEFEGLKLRIATPEDLIILKLLAGSLQDIEDARGILRSQQGSLSRQLLQELCPHHLQEMLDALLDEVSQGQC